MEIHYGQNVVFAEMYYCSTMIVLMLLQAEEELQKLTNKEIFFG